MSQAKPRLSSMAAGLDNVRRCQRAQTGIKVILEQALEELERVSSAKWAVARLTLAGPHEE